MAVATATVDKEKKAKAEVTPDATIAAAYEKASRATEVMELTILSLRRDLAEQASVISENAEMRRRAQGVVEYDAEVARQKILDEQIRQDRDRDLYFKARETAVRDAEEELLSLLNVRRDVEFKVPAAKTIRVAFDAAILKAGTDGEGKVVCVLSVQNSTNHLRTLFLFETNFNHDDDIQC